ncbi:MAG: hypothetical protein QM286_01280 [Acidobacteriota bacterium]|nr:hypothetical protein [Acidobacteriota bacterium]
MTGLPHLLTQHPLVPHPLLAEATILCLCPDERDHPNVAHSPHAITVPCPDRHCDQHTTRGPHRHTILPQPYCPLHRQQTVTSH